MKHRLMDLLACPGCGNYPLELTVLADEKPAGLPVEILEGILGCARCAQEYPVIDGIPRFNPDVYSDYPEFFRKHARHFRNQTRDDLGSFEALHTETKRSFGISGCAIAFPTTRRIASAFTGARTRNRERSKVSYFSKPVAGWGAT